MSIVKYKSNRSRSRSRSSSSDGHALVKMPDPESTLARTFLAQLHERNAERSDRNDSIIYVDNIQKSVTKEEFLEAFIKCMRIMGLLVRPGDPFLKSCKPKNNTFIMLDFRCVEEANNSLVLNGMSFKGQELKVTRPKHYSGSQPTSVNSMNCLFGNYAIKNAKKRSLEDILATGDKPIKKIDPPSRVLCLKRIVKNSDLQTEAEYVDILDDIRCECAKFGRIEGLVMPKPGEKGAGNCYVAFETVEEALNARRVMSGRRFNGKFVEPCFHPEVMYMERDFRETWELRALN